MSYSAEIPGVEDGEFSLVGKHLEMGDVRIDIHMAECVRDFIAQEFLPAIDSTQVAELDDEHDLSLGRKAYSYPGDDGRMHRYFAAVAMHHGSDTWTVGVLTTDTITGQVQHRKMKFHRFIMSSGQVLEAYVQKKYIIDMADLDIDSVLKHNNGMLRRKVVEMPLNDDDCWGLLEQLDTLRRKAKPELYLGIPVNLYPKVPS